MADVDVYYQFDLRGLALREILRSEPKCLRYDENVERYRKTYAVPKATLASLKPQVVLNDGNTKQPSKYEI